MNLQAVNGKLVAIEQAGTDSARRVYARTLPDRAGPWETITEERQSDGTVALACQGRYASAQPNGRLEWNRQAIGPWEAFERVALGANVVAYRSVAFNRYLCADQGKPFTTHDWSGPLVTCDRPAIGPWETFTAIGTAGHGIDPTPVVAGRPRRGLVRRGAGRMYADDDGEFYPLGDTLMNAVFWWTADRDRLRRQFAYLEKFGHDYYRAFSSVYWGEVSVDPRRPDYADAFVQTLECGYNDYGLRMHLSVFAGPDPWFRAIEDYEAHVRRLGNLLQARAHMVLDAEGMNEADVFFGGNYTPPVDEALLRRICAAMRQYLPVALIGATSDMPGAHADRGKPLQVEPSRAWGCTTAIAQPARVPTDDGWYEVSVPMIDWRTYPDPIHNNEPVGPGASSVSEDSPLKLATLRAVSIIGGSAAFVLHNAAGIDLRAHTNTDATHPRPVAGNLDETPGIDAIMTAVRAIDQWLPAHATDGRFFDMRSASSPVQCSSAAYRGWLRITDEPTWWAVLPGVQGAVTLSAHRPTSLSVIDILDGPIATHRLGAGESVAVSPRADVNGRGTLILRGTFEDQAPDVPELPEQEPAREQAFRTLFEQARAAYPTPTPAALDAMEPTLQTYGGEGIEHDSFGLKRGRWYLPGSGGPYAHYVDFVHYDNGQMVSWTWEHYR